ncbi:hypothetical protein FOZ62_021928 [Perkinsus olseni]|uniref:Uncharacterized protein n=1 Tax=Perkinsus olseni TaxID=32597 RepID=A0A7J6Q0X5_PEROL|nr:hypothetical protein FOZ62_021928 [Perkinsus olseni]
MAVAAAKAGPASKGNRSRRRQSLRESLDRANELRESVEKKYGVGRRGSGKAHDVKLVVCGDGLVGGRSRSRTPPQTRAAKSPRFTREAEGSTKDPTERFWSALEGKIVEHRVQHIMPEEHAKQAFIDRNVSPSRPSVAESTPKVQASAPEPEETARSSADNGEVEVSSEISSLVRQLREDRDGGDGREGSVEEGDDDILDRWRARRKGLGIVFDSVDTVIEEDDDDAGGAERVLERIRKRLGRAEAPTASTHKASMSPSRLVRRLLRRHDRLEDSLVLTSSSSSSTFTSSARQSSSLPECASTARPSPAVESVVPSIDLLGSPRMGGQRVPSVLESAAAASISFDLTPREPSQQPRAGSMDSLALSADEEVERPMSLMNLIEFEDAPQTVERSRLPDDSPSTASRTAAVEVSAIDSGVQVTPEMIDCAVQVDLLDAPLGMAGRRRSFSGPVSRRRALSQDSGTRGDATGRAKHDDGVPVMLSCEDAYTRAREEFRALVAEFVDR